MSEVYLYDPVTYAVLFEFDADTKERRSGNVKWTDKPTEAGVNLSDYGYQPPEKFRVEGLISAWPMTGGTLPLRVSQADAALRKLRDLRQPVGLITKWWAAEVVIDSCEASQGRGDGERLEFSIECHIPRIASVKYASVPAARLKASVKKRAAKAKAGGAAAGKAVKKKRPLDLIYKATNALGITNV